MTTKRACTIVLFTLVVYCLSCANNPLWASELPKKQAHTFRKQGYEAQLKGDYTSALSFYKKAIELDPFYAIAYNDLGIVYEKMNLLSEAERAYQKAIELDPQYTGSYTNLALLYEKNKDFENAARLWRKRIELGDPSDTWTYKAKRHLEGLASADKHLYRIYEESETLELIEEVKDLKQDIKDSSQLAAEVYFERGKQYYERGQYLEALRELHRASNLAPRNKEIEQLLIEAQKRTLLSP